MELKIIRTFSPTKAVHGDYIKGIWERILPASTAKSSIQDDLTKVADIAAQLIKAADGFTCVSSRARPLSLSLSLCRSRSLFHPCSPSFLFSSMRTPCSSFNKIRFLPLLCILPPRRYVLFPEDFIIARCVEKISKDTFVLDSEECDLKAARLYRQVANTLVKAGVSAARVFWAFDGLYESAARDRADLTMRSRMRSLMLVIAGYSSAYVLNTAPPIVAGSDEGLIIEWCAAARAAGSYDVARLEFNRNRARLVGRVADVYPQWNSSLDSNAHWAAHPGPPRLAECKRQIESS